jgi:hypothetical protein
VSQFLREGQHAYIRVVLTRRTADDFGDWEVVPITRTKSPVREGEYLYVRKEAIVLAEDIRKMQ